MMVLAPNLCPLKSKQECETEIDDFDLELVHMLAENEFN